MNPPSERTVRAGRIDCRVWEKGRGEPLGFLGGLRGLPRWTPFLDRLAAGRRVVAPSLPGFPGARGHDALDDVADWVTATLDVLDASGLAGCDLIGASVGATLAAEVAAFSGATVRRLVLIAPFGLFVPEAPVADLWAQKPRELPSLLSAHPERLEAALDAPAGADPTEWQLTANRANEAAARLLWPLGDLGLAKRLHRVRAPTLLVWGAQDRVVPPSHAKRYASGIAGWVELREIGDAGHTVEIDQPDAVARVVLDFL
ncbi:MAG: alpha/beta fold hydrolase [Myxococcota bacterium]|nr:alpha/beta fold hydrolase [Myxococcota bacterium]